MKGREGCELINGLQISEKETSSLGRSSNLKMEGGSSSETLVLSHIRGLHDL
jgi:hypothetical protein